MREDIIYTTDDLCPSNLDKFEYWDRIKLLNPDLKLVAFTIANYRLKENISESAEFKDWYEGHKSWVEIAVHGYDHLYPPEAERDDFEECTGKALEILLPYLPEKYGYRSPGFKFTIRLEPVLKKLGFAYVAYADTIKYFDGRSAVPFNTHCTVDKYDNPIGRIWSDLCLRV